MEYFQNKPLPDGNVLVVVSTEPVLNLHSVAMAYIATAEQFEKAKSAVEPETEKKVVDIAEWKASHHSN